MKVFALVLLSVAAYVSAVPVDCKDGALKGLMVGFTGKENSYLKLTDVAIPTLERFSSCWWAQSFVDDEDTEGLTYWSYVTDNQKTGSIAARDVKHFEMWINKQRTFGGADFDIRYGLWHHLCFTWCNQEGEYQIFKDGLLLKAGKRFKKGVTIQGGGELYVGQYLTQIGQVHKEYALEANLASLSMWDSVIDGADVMAAALSRDASIGCGNLVSWASFKESDMVNVDTCPNVLTGDVPMGEFKDKVLQMDNAAGPHGYTQTHQPIPDMKAFSICTWGRTTEPNIRADLFGYRLQDNAVGSIVVRNPSNMRVYINTKGAPESGAAVNDGKWHHVCVTWNSDGGKFSYWGDGNMVLAGDGLVPGETVVGGGALVLGVTQNRIGTKFDFKKRFNHELAGFNIWSNVGSEAEIRALLKGPCEANCGDIVSWNAFSSLDITPDVLVKDSDIPYEK